MGNSRKQFSFSRDHHLKRCARRAFGLSIPPWLFSVSFAVKVPMLTQCNTGPRSRLVISFVFGQSRRVMTCCSSIFAIILCPMYCPAGCPGCSGIRFPLAVAKVISQRCIEVHRDTQRNTDTQSAQMRGVPQGYKQMHRETQIV